MIILASDVLTEARTVLLNDPNGVIYPAASMYPVITKVLRELETKLAAWGFGTAKTIDSTVTVAAGTDFLQPDAGLNTNFLFPIWLGERPSGSTQSFKEMIQTTWEPDIQPQTDLLYWAWREDKIQLVGATTDREVLVKYHKTLFTGSLLVANSPIQINGSLSWMAQRTAIVAARTIGGNPSRADQLEADLVDIWDDLRFLMMKNLQAMPVRRRRTRFRKLS